MMPGRSVIRSMLEAMLASMLISVALSAQDQPPLARACAECRAFKTRCHHGLMGRAQPLSLETRRRINARGEDSLTESDPSQWLGSAGGVRR